MVDIEGQAQTGYPRVHIRLLEQATAPVYVRAGQHIVQAPQDNIKAAENAVPQFIDNIPDKIVDLAVRMVAHVQNPLGGYFRFIFPNILHAKQNSPAQIGY